MSVKNSLTLIGGKKTGKTIYIFQMKRRSETAQSKFIQRLQGGLIPTYIYWNIHTKTGWVIQPVLKKRKSRKSLGLAPHTWVEHVAHGIPHQVPTHDKEC
jgi:hypothetical protein